MAYDTSKLTKLQHLKDLATRVKTDYDALSARVDGLVTAGGEPNVLEGVKVNGIALSIANKMVDILIASGATNGTVSVAGVDIAVKGLAALAYKAEISEAELSAALKAVIDAKAEATDVTALSGKVTTLIGSDTGKSVRTIANEELAAQLIPETAKESLDTLAEIAAWIQDHPDDASAMNSAITALQNLVGTLPAGATSTTVVAYIDEAIAAINIGDYAKTADVNAALAGKVNTTDIATDAEVTEMLTEVFGADKTAGA